MPSSSWVNTSGQWSTHSPSPVHRSWSIHTRIGDDGTRHRCRSSSRRRPYARAGMNEAIEPPVAPTRPHEWKRPTGVVDDPWAWLADRDDPATIAYLEAENAYSDQVLRRAGPGRPRRDGVPGDQVARPGDRPLRAGAPRRLVVRDAHDRGQVVPGVLPQPRPERAGHAGIGDPRLQRRGRGPRVLRRARRRTVAGPHPARLVERRRRQRALHVAGPRPRHRRRRSTRSPARRRGAVSPGQPATTGCSTPGPTTRCGRYQIWRHRLGHGAGRRRPRPQRGRRTLLPPRLVDAQRALDRHRLGVEDERRVVRPASPTIRRGRRHSSGRGRPTSSTASTTGATASSCSPTSTPPTSA